MSSSRQQTLMLDRRRTRAVSMYLADHREILLNMLPNEMKTNKNTKRKELERLARKHFHKASESEQQAYYARVRTVILASGEFRSTGEGEQSRSSGEGEQLVESRSGGEGEQLVEFRSADEGGQPSIEQPLVEPRSIIEEQPSIEQLLVEFRGVGFRSSRDGKAGCPPRTPARGVTSSSCGLRDSLMRETQHLQALYGHAGALETMACAIRFLEVVDMNQWKNRRAVKLAVVVGMAAKFIATPSDEQHVRKLWAKFAGDSSEHEVRKLEKEVFMAWARS